MLYIHVARLLRPKLGPQAGQSLLNTKATTPSKDPLPTVASLCIMHSVDRYVVQYNVELMLCFSVYNRHYSLPRAAYPAQVCVTSVPYQLSLIHI